MNSQNESAASTYWWLSFVDNGKNVGVCIVQAADFLSAVARTHALGINPGGQCLGVPIPQLIPSQGMRLDTLLQEVDLPGAVRLGDIPSNLVLDTEHDAQ